MSTITRILVPIDFSPCSDAALDWALAVADACGAEVEVLHVWSPGGAQKRPCAIFAETPEGRALEERLTAAELDHVTARVSGRLEFGDEASNVIIDILRREPFDLVVLGRHGDGDCAFGGHVATRVATVAPCKVVRLRPTGDPEAA